MVFPTLAGYPLSIVSRISFHLALLEFDLVPQHSGHNLQHISIVAFGRGHVVSRYALRQPSLVPMICVRSSGFPSQIPLSELHSVFPPCVASISCISRLLQMGVSVGSTLSPMLCAMRFYRGCQPCIARAGMLHGAQATATRCHQLMFSLHRMRPN